MIGLKKRAKNHNKMRVLIQRVTEASVTIEKGEKRSIGGGLVVFVAFEASDSEKDIEYLSNKVLNLRIFDDEEGVMNRSIKEAGGDLLVVSQFTLFANTKRGNRPSYTAAAKPEIAIPLYEKFCSTLSEIISKPIMTGIFGADMQVSLINDGPVTIWIDSK